MKSKTLYCFILSICAKTALMVNYDNYGGNSEVIDIRLDEDEVNETVTKPANENNCWWKIGAPELFKNLEKIDVKYSGIRTSIQNYFDQYKFDDHMLKNILDRRGVSHRAETIAHTNVFRQIPAGMNLGGDCMIKLPDSVLFFHRMKLRNNTKFQFLKLHNDFENLVFNAQLSLNDLHLHGAYERCITDINPATLIYAPSYGELDILIPDVKFDVQGRYRVIGDRLTIDVIVSELTTDNLILTYKKNSTDSPILTLKKENLGNFLGRLKTNLDKWIMDYFNDYLIYENLSDVPQISKLQDYDKERASELAVFMDHAILMIRQRLRDMGGPLISIPDFSIAAVYGLTIKLTSGYIEGLDTMYRRSVATTFLKEANNRYVDSIVGFSDLKVSYNYHITLPPILFSDPSYRTGVFILKFNDLTARLSLGLLKEPEVVEMDIDFVILMGTADLTVEGDGKIILSYVKHILKDQIITIMSDALMYAVHMLKSLPRCQPFLPGQLQKEPPQDDNYVHSPPNHI